MKQKWLLITIVLVAATLGVVAQDKMVVAIENAKYPWNWVNWRFKNNGIKLSRYFYNELAMKKAGTKTLVAGPKVKGFVNDLQKAQLLYIGRGDSCYAIPECRKAVDAFLARGGTIFYHRQAGYQYILTALGLGKPVIAKTGTVSGGVSPDCKSPLVREPFDLGKLGRWGFWGTSPWGKWSDRGQVLIHNRDDPSQALMVLFDGVKGKGKIILSHMGALLSVVPGEGASGAIVANIMRYVWGKLEKGALVPAVNAAPTTVHTNVPVTGLNPLYFNGLKKAAWWNPQWNHRLPLIVREPMGIDRKGLVVTVTCQLPGKPHFSSIRVISLGGRELVSQARVLDAAQNRFQVTFADDFEASTTHGYFIYCDDKAKPAPNYRDEVTMYSKGGFITLRNNRMEATFSGTHPDIYSLQAFGSSTGNQFQHGAGVRLCNGFSVKWEPKGTPGVKVLDNGPIRKTLEYFVKDKNGIEIPIIRFSMDANSQRLCYDMLIKKRRNGGVIRWFPGVGPNDKGPNSYAWPSLKSIRKVEFTTETKPVKPAFPLSEGWYAFHDYVTGQSVGEIFEPENMTFFGWGLYSGVASAHRGYVTSHSQIGLYRRALVVLPDYSGILRLRHEYLYYKNPPQVALGTVQNRDECPVKPTAPVWGKNFITYFHLGLYPHANFLRPWAGAYAAYWDEVLPRYRDDGYNGIGLFPFGWESFKAGKYKKEDDNKPSFVTELLDGARKHGAATYLLPPRMSGGMGAYIRLVKAGIIKDKKDKNGRYPITIDKFKAAACKAESLIAAEKPGMIMLADEMTYRMQKEDTDTFRKKYGMDPVGIPKGHWLPNIKLAKLKEPTQYNTVLFQINSYTDILRDMAKAARAVAPNAILCDQVNPSGMTSLRYGAPHDWEAHADFLDTISMDLYGLHRPLYKYFNKLMLGMFNNRKPVTQVVGCTSPSGTVYGSIACSAMWGVKVFSFFQARNTDVLRSTQEAHKTFSYFQDTGLGDLMVSMHPSRHIALLRDREAMFDDIRNGRWGGAFGSRHDTAVGNFAITPNFQADILMTRYLDLDNLKSYKALIIAADPVLSKKHCKTIENYVKGGGHVIIEGNSLRSPELQELAGLKLSRQRKNRKVSVKDTFIFRGTVFDLKPADARIALVSDNGTPLMFERKLDAGTVTTLAFDISLRLGGQDDLQTFVRTLCNQVVGPGLVSLEKSLCSKIDSNLLEDGRGNYLFSAWNTSPDSKDVIVKWNGTEQPERMVDIASGTASDFNGVIKLELPSGSIKQVFIGQKGRFDVPAAKILPAGTMPGFSEQPGRNIMTYKAPKVQGCAALKHPVKIEGQSYVAVCYPEASANYKCGADAIYNTLSKAKGINVKKIKDMSLANLEYYDAVIVPNFGTYGKMPFGWLKNLRQYVLGGGAALLCHRSVGYTPCKFAPLPEVGRNALSSVNRTRDMEVIAAHPITTDLVVKKRYPEDYRNPAFQTQIDANILKVGDRFRTGFADYVALSPAKGAVTLINGADGFPALVAGKAGKGKAVLCGLGLGQDKNGRTEHMTTGDGKVLLNAIYWLVDK